MTAGEPAVALSSAQQAAVVTLLLEEEVAASVLERLDPEDLRVLGDAMCGLACVEQAAVEDAVGAFLATAEAGALHVGNSEERVSSLLQRAVGAPRAALLVEQMEGAASARSLAIARWLDPHSLLALVGGEPPQVIAALLLMLEPRQAARVLALLPQDLQVEVVGRVARLERLPARARALLDTLLDRRMDESFGTLPLRAGGPRDAAALINAASRDVEHHVLPALARQHADLAQAITDELVTFAMLLELQPADMGRLLREIDAAMLVDALAGVDERGQEQVFAAMSARAAEGVRDELAQRGRVPGDAAERARTAMVTEARRLAAAGEISLRDESDG
ncbi:flagellar motor switch protein FliG [Qipengyuania thermophila]|uniref:flagellar motor switch protein FliG n=1 Tax=Qipengyuania thermophila TaxID=2509361 RepID=UPI0013EAD504|nr:FliG C-terminal domain-containing protein [Qipengyuania thermophila]